MDADLDLLLIAVYCTVDDLLPRRAANARRTITDQEVITPCIAQAMLDCRSDEQFLAVARYRLAHLFPALPERSAFHKRRLRLSAVIEALIAEFARHSPASTTSWCSWIPHRSSAHARSTTTRGSRLADYGYCASHSRFFWGFRLHALFALDGTPRALALTSPKIDEKTVCLQLVARFERQPGQILIVIGDKNFCGRQFEADPARARRHDPPPAPQRRTRPRTTPRADPPTHRIDLRHRQGHPRPRTPPLLRLAPAARPTRLPLRRARRRDRPQPPPRPPQPLAGLLHP
jgi:hypothetical protein